LTVLDNPDGYITLLDDCPLCHGDLEPHCSRSRACDIVRCQSCKRQGSIDGRWWPKRMPASLEAYESIVRDHVRSEAKRMDIPARLLGVDESELP
jgi:hypothetical protein